MPGHAWRTVTATGGPTHTFRAGQQVELLRGTTMMSGTYQFPTDSTLVEDVTGLLPGLGAGGPTHLTLRYNVRVLPAKDGRERVELRADAGVDTLARVDWARRRIGPAFRARRDALPTRCGGAVPP